MAKPDWYDTDNCETHDKGVNRLNGLAGAGAALQGLFLQ